MSHRSDAHSVALVTGASSGIGATYSERLASSVRNVVLMARCADRLEALAQRLREQHGSAHVLIADLSEDGGIDAATLSIQSESETSQWCRRPESNDTHTTGVARGIAPGYLSGRPACLDIVGSIDPERFPSSVPIIRLLISRSRLRMGDGTPPPFPCREPCGSASCLRVLRRDPSCSSRRRVSPLCANDLHRDRTQCRRH